MADSARVFASTHNAVARGEQAGACYSTIVDACAWAESGCILTVQRDVPQAAAGDVVFRGESAGQLLACAAEGDGLFAIVDELQLVVVAGGGDSDDTGGVGASARSSRSSRSSRN